MSDRGPGWFEQLRRLDRGDPEALGAIGRLVVGHLSRLRAYDVADSWDDVVQEVVMKLWGAWRAGQLESESAFVSYTGTVTRNSLVDWIERARRAGKPGSDEDVERWDRVAEASPDVDPGEAVLLEHALETLSERHRLVIESIYLRGHNDNETAREIGVSRQVVNRLHHEGLSRLRSAMLSRRGSRSRAAAQARHP